MSLLNIIIIVVISLGMISILISTIGLLLFPDFFTRLHVIGIADTMGVILVLLGMILLTGLKLMSLKILILLLLILITNPLGTNLIMSASIHNKDYLNYNEKYIKGAHKSNAPSKPRKSPKSKGTK